MSTAAQEATPAVEGFMPEGITFEPVAFAPGMTPPPTVDLSVARVSFEPGAGFDIDAGDPSYVLAVIESGELTVRLEGVLTVTRAGALAAAMSEEEGGAATPATEEIAAGHEVTLGAGDTVLFPPNVSGAIGNDGQERTVVLAVFVGPPAAMTGEAAPTP
jgi:quercetin dioxygenase-like cupin family protein